MTDIFSKKKRSAVMGRIRSSGNKDTELRLMQVFRAHGISGWRRGVRMSDAAWRKPNGRRTEAGSQKPEAGILTRRARSTRRFSLKRPGGDASPCPKVRPFSVRPDFVFRKLRVVVFVDGCFWHGCPKHATWPKGNAAFWKKKILGNRQRDRLVNRRLRRAGWRVLRIWGHELTKRNEARLVRRLADAGVV